jgi:hypothetical protein
LQRLCSALGFDWRDCFQHPIPNEQTAASRVPPTLLALADEVIE